MRPSELITTFETLLKRHPAPPPILLAGPPGVGKSDVWAQVADRLDFDLMVTHPVVDEPTDAKGLPKFVGDHAEFVPFGHLHRAMNATKPLLWCLDDLGQATPAVQAAYMQLLLARAINGHGLPDCVYFGAATNRAQDRAGVHRLITPLAGRFLHFNFDLSVEDWQAHAMAHDFDPRVRSFINFKPDVLHKFDAKSVELAQPTPRTWEFVSRVIVGRQSFEYEEVAACVGETASMFCAHADMYGKLPDPAVVLANPSTADVPKDEPSVLCALGTSLVEYLRQNDAKHLEAFATYAARMPSENAAMAFRDAIGALDDARVLDTPAGKVWIKDHRDMILV